MYVQMYHHSVTHEYVYVYSVNVLYAHAAQVTMVSSQPLFLLLSMAIRLSRTALLN